MRFSLVLSVVLTGCMLSSCGNKAATGGPHATVTMRDGTTVSGTVLSSSASEIQIAGDDKVTRTIPMTQVKTVDYGDLPATTAASAPPLAAPGSSPLPAQSAPPQAAPAPAPEPEPEHDKHYHPDASAVTTKTYDAPAGTRISVRTEETIDSAKAVEGQTFAAEVTKNVLDRDGNIVIPRGANAQIIIRSSAKGGKIRGASDLVMDLYSVSIGGRRYHLETVDLAQKGHDGVGVNKRTGTFAGGGAAVGAIIGAIAGGGKGAAIGAGSGAGAGVVGEILTKGHSIRVPVESVLTFQLERALHVTAAE